MNEPAVKLERVSVRYRVPHERIPSLKEFAIRWLRRRLRYADFWALHDVDLEVARGEVFGILGANGAGKSTLLKVVARVLRPTSGRVRVWGRVAPLLDLGAGFDFELSGRENIFLNGTILGFSKADVASRLDRIVEFADLREFIDAPLRTYSSGMVARLGFAIATDVEPEVLIVDEVLAVGDAAFQKKSADRIRSFREKGTTIMLVTHDSAALKAMCSRVMWLKRGEVEAVGPVEEVLAKYQA
jgi:ABC-2 type transport system ATP-binding protein/lipopolysaccharide transport system ATP-binding protein